jgi:hypothetical protein
MPPPSIENVVRWRTHPELFVTELFRDPKTGGQVTLAPWHKQALEAVRDSDRVSVRAARGVGKTAMLAWLCLYRLTCYNDAFNVFTAPRREQMSMAAWREIKKWIALMHPHMRDNFEVQSARIYMPGLRNEAVATTVGSGNYEGLQGIHDRNLMFFVDEANGVPDNVMDVVLGSTTTTGTKILLTGNPRQSAGLFFRTHCSKSYQKVWTTIRVSAFDMDGMDFYNPGYIEEMRHTWGEQSWQWSAYVLGEFPTEQEDAVIPLGHIRDAVAREVVPLEGYHPVWGFDPAAGGDRSVLAKRKGNILFPLVWWRERDQNVSMDRVRKEFWDTPDKEKPAAIVVDAVGLGAPIADVLRRDGLPIVHWVSSENSTHKTLYRNKRSEMWHLGREWFEQQIVKIPDDDELVEELAAPIRFVPKDTNTSYGTAYIVEAKEEIKERIGRSTDFADAVLLSLCAKWRERDADYIRERLPGASGRRRKPIPAGATWMSAI